MKYLLESFVTEAVSQATRYKSVITSSAVERHQRRIISDVIAVSNLSAAELTRPHENLLHDVNTGLI